MLSRGSGTRLSARASGQRGTNTALANLRYVVGASSPLHARLTHALLAVVGMVFAQGPLPDKRVDGRDVRAVADYLVGRMVPDTDLATQPCIVLFRRTLNRRILNEAELVSALHHHYGLPVEVGSMPGAHGRQPRK